MKMEISEKLDNALLQNIEAHLTTLLVSHRREHLKSNKIISFVMVA